VKEGDHLEDWGIAGNIKMDLLDVGWGGGGGGIDCIFLAQDRDRWRALVNAVMKFQVP